MILIFSVFVGFGYRRFWFSSAKKLSRLPLLLSVCPRDLPANLHKNNASNVLWGNVKFRIVLRELLKTRFNILNCICLMHKGWQGMTTRTMEEITDRMFAWEIFYWVWGFLWWPYTCSAASCSFSWVRR